MSDTTPTPASEQSPRPRRRLPDWIVNRPDPPDDDEDGSEHQDDG